MEAGCRAFLLQGALVIALLLALPNYFRIQDIAAIEGDQGVGASKEPAAISACSVDGFFSFTGVRSADEATATSWDGCWEASWSSKSDQDHIRKQVVGTIQKTISQLADRFATFFTGSSSFSTTIFLLRSGSSPSGGDVSQYSAEDESKPLAVGAAVTSWEASWNPKSGVPHGDDKFVFEKPKAKTDKIVGTIQKNISQLADLTVQGLNSLQTYCHQAGSSFPLRSGSCPSGGDVSQYIAEDESKPLAVGAAVTSWEASWNPKSGVPHGDDKFVFEKPKAKTDKIVGTIQKNISQLADLTVQGLNSLQTYCHQVGSSFPRTSFSLRGDCFFQPLRAEAKLGVDNRTGQVGPGRHGTPHGLNRVLLGRAAVAQA